jgi:hypothetical protein
MRTWAIRACLVLLVLAILAYWIPAVIAVSVIRALSGTSLKEIWTDVRLEAVELLIVWLKAWRDPVGDDEDDGVNSGA